MAKLKDITYEVDTTELAKAVIRVKEAQKELTESAIALGDVELSFKIKYDTMLTDKEIASYIWDELPIPLSQEDIDTCSDEYLRYLNAVHWAKWGRDNHSGIK